jgi:peptide-methionine (S)-S-oxide reductase
VGYAGGSSKNPTYHSLGDHSESVQVDFDPSRISYEQLLTIFWAGHHPGSRPWSRQYMNAVFTHNEAQERLALASRKQIAEKIKGEVFTQVLPGAEFTLAEDYHQKYYLRRAVPLYEEMRRLYPDERDFINSTAAARLNGYLAGYGTEANLQLELDKLGLSPAAQALMQEKTAGRLEGYSGPGCPLPR